MIGILAGMGPKSTAPFVDRVVEECQKIYGAKYDMDYPHMMIYSCPTPFYIDRELDHLEMEKAIIEGAKRLEGTGVDFIAMPCNTAHLYFNHIQNALSVSILNMVDETIKEIPENAKNVALLATPATVQAGIYQEGLRKSGIDFIHKEGWQHSVTQIISNIKNGKIQEANTLWERLTSELSLEVDAVIIACTDLNVVSGKQTEALTFVDSSACLATAVVNKYLHIGEKI